MQEQIWLQLANIRKEEEWNGFYSLVRAVSFVLQINSYCVTDYKALNRKLNGINWSRLFE